MRNLDEINRIFIQSKWSGNGPKGFYIRINNNINGFRNVHSTTSALNSLYMEIFNEFIKE